MSDREQKDMAGVLFKNNKKDDAHPNWSDYQGSAKIEGVDYWMSAWVKESDAGNKYMSFSFKAKDENAQKPANKQQDDDSSLPF